MKKNKDSSLEAKRYAFLLLKYRLRSQKEIYQRLTQKGFSKEVIHQVIAFLTDKAFLDDRLFAKTWIDSRLKRSLGLRRIIQELKLKGIAQEIIDREIAVVKDSYSEPEAILKLAQERLARLKSVEPDKAKSRLYGYLLRRGYSGEAVAEVVNRLCERTY